MLILCTQMMQQKQISKIFKFNLIFPRSSRPEVFCKKGVLRNFEKFTGKHLCQSLFFNKVAGLRLFFIKKETLAQVFSCEFLDISKNTFYCRTPPMTASLFRLIYIRYKYLLKGVFEKILIVKHFFFISVTWQLALCVCTVLRSIQKYSVFIKTIITLCLPQQFKIN